MDQFQVQFYLGCIAAGMSSDITANAYRFLGRNPDFTSLDAIRRAMLNAAPTTDPDWYLKKAEQVVGSTGRCEPGVFDPNMFARIELEVRFYAYVMGHANSDVNIRNRAQQGLTEEQQLIWALIGSCSIEEVLYKRYLSI